MDSVYSNPPSTKTQKNYTAYFPTEINAYVTWCLERSRNESKKLAHNTAIGSMYINALTKYVIGQGLVPNPAPESAFLDWSEERRELFVSQVSALFRMMSGKGIDWYGRHSFKELQRIAFQNILVDGDILLHRCYSRKEYGYKPKIQVLAGSWVASPDGADTKDCTGGVVLTKTGVERAYYIKQVDDYLNDTFTFRRVNRYNPTTGFEEFMLIKLFSKEANQVRGIPYLTPIKNDIIDLQAFNTAHLSKAIANAIFSLFITNQPDTPVEQTIIDKTAELAGISAEEAGAPAPNDEDRAFALSTGSITELEPGQDVKTVESQLAGADYTNVINTRLDIMGGATGVAREMALSRYDASFSAARGTIGASEKFFAPIRNAFAYQFCTPVYEQIVDYGIRMGLIECPEYFESEINKKAILAVSWTGPSPVSIDPTKEINACVTAIENSLMTHEQAAQTLWGKDFDEIVDGLILEKRKLEGLNGSEEMNGRDNG